MKQIFLTKTVIDNSTIRKIYILRNADTIYPMSCRKQSLLIHAFEKRVTTERRRRVDPMSRVLNSEERGVP